MPSNFRFIVAVFLLAGTALLLRSRNVDEIVPSRQRFASFPRHLGTWVGSDIDIPPDDLKTLGPGDFLIRDYRNSAADDTTGVGLFMAYFPSQRMGDTIHSPQNCLPGSGWLPVRSSRIEIAVPGHEPFLANRFVIAKGDQRGLAIYWYWAHGRGVASEYWAKFYLVRDSIRFHRSDGSLIRVTTQLRQHESASDAQGRLLSFLKTTLPAMDAYIPR